MKAVKDNVVVALTGNDAVAEAMRQVNPDVVAAYPITPQTELMHKFADYVADGDVKTEFVLVESEHSAMSAAVGASAAGSRVMTATSANGLALMWEIVYIAASTRLPIVMAVVNRALSAPINIHCDHSDAMGARDAGWIQLFSENSQEAYDNAIQAVRIAEDRDVLLPVMNCLDGFILSHTLEPVEIVPDRFVTDFIGEFKPVHNLLDSDNPTTFGPLDFHGKVLRPARKVHDRRCRAHRGCDGIHMRDGQGGGGRFQGQG
jgi:pyruvate ferredoxin oxidoreductase alpha subunit